MAQSSTHTENSIHITHAALGKDSDGVGWMRQAIGGRQLDSVGPFLLLDHWGGDYRPNEAVSNSDHPHRGQVTVSIVLEGGIEHEDSAGFDGKLSAGDVQWLTAGSGVMHSEMHSEELWTNGGRCEGFQLWLNLPAALKMSRPKYQDTPSAAIPVVQLPAGGGSVRVITGRFQGTPAVIETTSPVTILDVRVDSPEAGSAAADSAAPRPLNGEEHADAKSEYFTHMVEDGHSGFLYVYRGKVQFRREGDVNGMVAARIGDTVRVASGETWTISRDGATGGSAGVLFGSGEPIDEPIARYGPFVMNTQDEISQALRDYQAGKFGKIAGFEGRERKRALARVNIERRLAAEAAAGRVSHAEL